MAKNSSKQRQPVTPFNPEPAGIPDPHRGLRGQPSSAFGGGRSSSSIRRRPDIRQAPESGSCWRPALHTGLRLRSVRQRRLGLIVPAKQDPAANLGSALARLSQPNKKPAAKKPKKPKKPAADPHSLDAAQAPFEKLTTNSAKPRRADTLSPADIQKGAKDAAKMTKKLRVKPAAVTIAKAPKAAVK